MALARSSLLQFSHPPFKLTVQRPRIQGIELHLGGSDTSSNEQKGRVFGADPGPSVRPLRVAGKNFITYHKITGFTSSIGCQTLRKKKPLQREKIRPPANPKPRRHRRYKCTYVLRRALKAAR